MRKFDFAIGNPAYQAEVENDGDRANPLYDRFMDGAFQIADKVEMITPGRFLFNAGQTSKAWNKKMLSDTHFKVLHYEPKSAVIFPGTDIKGGVAITYRDRAKSYGSIDTFTIYNELNSIVRKVVQCTVDVPKLNTIIASQGLYRFSDKAFKDHPEISEATGSGTGSKIVSSVIKKLPGVFLDKAHANDTMIRFLGRIDSQRVYKYIKREYLVENDYIDKYNLFVPEANNTGAYGETLTEPVIGLPRDGSADTYLSAGKFDSITEVENLAKYMKTKYFRALLGVKKVTQHCPPPVWSIIPIQNFASSSDINWNTSIANIDRQLYKKYGLYQEEIDFIETHVKEMT